MLVYGFPTEGTSWDDDPFSGSGNSPEDVICEVVHVYKIRGGGYCVGIEASLGLSERDMEDILKKWAPGGAIHRFYVEE